MNKPQIIVSLNISCKDLLERGESEMSKIRSLFAFEVSSIAKDFDDGKRLFEPDKPPKEEVPRPTSRHHQSVAANTRIMDAIEFINKEMRLLKGHSENGTLKVFEELKGILLGI
jgi:hypothetical protein